MTVYEQMLGRLRLETIAFATNHLGQRVVYESPAAYVGAIATIVGRSVRGDYLVVRIEHGVGPVRWSSDRSAEVVWLLPRDPADPLGYAFIVVGCVRLLGEAEDPPAP